MSLANWTIGPLAVLGAASACVGDIESYSAAQGPVEECPLAPAESRCADTATLEVCAGSEVEVVDCAAIGQFCVEGSFGAACAGEGETCGNVPEEGVCTGEVFAACVNGQLAITDCATLGQRCAHQDTVGWGCATECALEAVDATGACTGEASYRRCEEDRIVAHDCPSEQRCFDEAAGPVCVSAAEACAGLGPIGLCDGDMLRTCGADGWPVVTDCGASGEVCAYADDSTGYACLATATAGAYVVAGLVEYEDRPITPGSLGAPTPKPARSVRVAVVRNSDDATLATAATSDDGSYTLRYDAEPGTALRVIAATSSQIPERPIRVQKNNGYTHGLSSESFEAAPETARDILLSEADDMARPFNVFDCLVEGMIFTSALGATSFTPIVTTYQPGSNGSSYYMGSSNTITLAGYPDDDGWDDGIVLHEFGHYHQDEYGDSDNPGGSHPNPGGDDPRLAWAEGQATAISMAITGVPAYIDYNTSDGGWSVELEDNIHGANFSGSMSQYVLEWMVAELLWDAGDDGVDSDGDPIAGTHHDVHQVTTTYFHDPTYAGRGYSGVDLVDWLDGYLIRVGADVCDALTALVHDWYRFPYDFAGPTGCP